MTVEELWEKIYTNAYLYGVGIVLYKKTESGEIEEEVVDPEKYGELADALKWDMDNRIK